MIASLRPGQLMDVILKKYFWVLNLLVIGVCATLAGRATAGMIVSAVLIGDGPPAPSRSAPVLPQGEPPHGKDIEVILQRNIFCATCAPIKPTEERPADAPVDTTPRKSALPLQLVATMVSPPGPERVPRPARVHDRHRERRHSRRHHSRHSRSRTVVAAAEPAPTSPPPPVVDDWSLAVIRDAADETKRVGIYRRGDTLPKGAVVLQVVPRRVYIMVGRQVEYLDQDGAPPPPPASAVAVAEPTLGPGEQTGLEKDIEKGIRCAGASNCEVDKSLVDKLLANTTALATSARFVPSSKDNKPNGFKVYAIRPGSVFAKLGLQNADLVKAINGLDMSTPDKAFEAYTKLKSATHLTLNVERRGENVTYDYQIR